MAELVFRSVRKIARADWLLNGPMFLACGTDACTVTVKHLRIGSEKLVVSSSSQVDYNWIEQN